jgi:hypothetical protein
MSNMDEATRYGKLANETLQDAEKRWLVEQGATAGKPLADMWRELLLGAGYSGINDDMYAKWLADGGSFSVAQNFTFDELVGGGVITSNGLRTARIGFGTTSRRGAWSTSVADKSVKTYVEFQLDYLPPATTATGAAVEMGFASSTPLEFGVFAYGGVNPDGYMVARADYGRSRWGIHFTNGGTGFFVTIPFTEWSADPGDIIMLAIDQSTYKGWAGHNGVWYNNGDPGAGTNPTLSHVNYNPTETLRAGAGFEYINGQVTIPDKLVYNVPDGFVTI